MPHGKFEIRVYADAMLKTVQAWVPMAFEAFRDYRMGAVTLSAQMIAILRRMLANEAVTQETSGLSKREWREMMEIIGPKDLPHFPCPRDLHGASR